MGEQWIGDAYPKMIVPKGLATIFRLCLRSLPLMVLAASFTTAGQENQARNISSQISIRLTTSKKAFAVRESVRIKVHISNVGDKPVLVENFLSMSRNTSSHIEFELRDTHGRLSPSVEEIADTFSSRVAANPATALLRSWLLLYPGYSLVGDILLDKDFFAFLGKPGKYRLSGTYFSSGLLYPSAYRDIGLTEEEVRSLPFQSWSGQISTNTVNFEIVPDHRLRQ